MNEYDYQAERIVEAYHNAIRMIEIKEDNAREQYLRQKESLDTMRQVLVSLDTETYNTLGGNSELCQEGQDILQRTASIINNAEDEVESDYRELCRKLEYDREEAHDIYSKSLRYLDEQAGGYHYGF